LRTSLTALAALLLVPVAVVSATAATAAGASTGPTSASFTLTQTGSLSISTPDTVSWGSVPAGGATAGGPLGTVTVTDTRSGSLRTWSASVSSTDFLTGSGQGAADIPAADVSYSAGLATTTGTGVFAPGPGGALGAAKTAYGATAESGSTTASWNPTITVTIPSSAVAGTYTGTITHSVA